MAGQTTEMVGPGEAPVDNSIWEWRAWGGSLGLGSFVEDVTSYYYASGSYVYLLFTLEARRRMPLFENLAVSTSWSSQQYHPSNFLILPTQFWLLRSDGDLASYTSWGDKMQMLIGLQFGSRRCLLNSIVSQIASAFGKKQSPAWHSLCQ